MILTASCLPQTVVDEATRQTESMSVTENSNTITPIKIPLVSNEPILATSPQYILVNESTRRKKQFVIYEVQLQERFTIRYFNIIQERLIDALWYDKQHCFLILTSTRIYTLDPIVKQINLLEDIMPRDNQEFKCFNLLNETTLLIRYDQWDTNYIDQWKENENGKWIMIEKIPLELTINEFIGNIITINENDCTYLGITIYNHLIEEWRLELRYADTLILYKAICLSETNMASDCRVIFIKKAESKTKLLVFSTGNPHITAIDDQWKCTEVNYKHPPQRMALLNDNCLIVRTTERVDIHEFL